MKKLVLTLMLGLVSISMQQAQRAILKDKEKFDVKDDVFLVNGAEQFKVISMGALSGDHKVVTLSDEDVAFLKFRQIFLKDEISNSNPKGQVSFLEITS